MFSVLFKLFCKSEKRINKSINKIHKKNENYILLKQARGTGMPEEAIFTGNFCHGAYQESKRGKQVCPRKQFLRGIFVTGHTGKAREGNRYAQGSDFPGKFLTLGIPEKQAKNKSMKSKRKDEII